MNLSKCIDLAGNKEEIRTNVKQTFFQRRSKPNLPSLNHLQEKETLKNVPIASLDSMQKLGGPISQAQVASSYFLNKTILIDIACKKYRIKEMKKLASSGIDTLDDKSKHEMAENALEMVVNEIGGNYKVLKKAGVLGALRANSKEMVQTIIENSKTLGDNNMKDQTKRNNMSFGYLQYLRKRRFFFTRFFDLEHK